MQINRIEQPGEGGTYGPHSLRLYAWIEIDCIFAFPFTAGENMPEIGSIGQRLPELPAYKFLSINLRQR